MKFKEENYSLHNMRCTGVAGGGGGGGGHKGQDFSQDFRIGCPKIYILGEWVSNFLFIPLHYVHKTYGY